MIPFISEFAALSCASFVFGVTQKIADGHHEHGMNLFRGAGIVFGILTGIVAGLLMSVSPILQTVYLGPLLYWIYKLKVDCIQLAIAAIIMLFSVFLSKNNFDFPLVGVLYVFIAHVVFDLVKHKGPWKSDSSFFSLRIHFHLIMIVYALWTESVYGYSTLVFNLLGTAAAEKFFKISPPKELL